MKPLWHITWLPAKEIFKYCFKNADLVCSVFGPGKRTVAPGHEIVEMGLVKLYRITGKQEYLSTAKFFIEARGQYKGYDKYQQRCMEKWLILAG